MFALHTSATPSTTSYAESIAHALCAYADQNPSFGTWLASLVRTIQVPGSTMNETLHSVTPVGLTPKNDGRAARRAQWLIDMSTMPETQERQRARAVLLSWARDYAREEPKAVLLGIAIGVLPIGLMGEMKKKADPMHIVVDTTLCDGRDSTTLLTTVIPLTHQVVEHGLIAASGRTAKLEPELGDWLFGGKPIALYSAPQATMHNLAETLTAQMIPHALARDSDGVIQAVAMTPAFDVTEVPYAHTLTSLTEHTKEY